MIENVYRPDLAYWGTRRQYVHWNIAYGYSHSSGGSVALADEYNAATWERNPSPNPYGTHWVSLASDANAVHDSPSNGVVW